MGPTNTGIPFADFSNFVFRGWLLKLGNTLMYHKLTYATHAESV